MKTASHGFEKISISLPHDVLEAIDQRAASERRTRSNFIAAVMVAAMTDEPAAAAATHREAIVDRTR
jgi:metal-responsive CopG/Arc/MetJ family transcriptional regulator